MRKQLQAKVREMRKQLKQQLPEAPPAEAELLSVVTLGQQSHRHITLLSELQKHILSPWDVSPILYDQLGAPLLEPT